MTSSRTHLPSDLHISLVTKSCLVCFQNGHTVTLPLKPWTPLPPNWMILVVFESTALLLHVFPTRATQCVPEGDWTPSLVSPCSEGFSRSLLTGVCAPLAAVRVHPPAFCPLFPSSNHLSRLTACYNSTEHHRSGFGQFIRTSENTIGIINCWQWELMCHWWALAQLREVENLLTQGLL